MILLRFCSHSQEGFRVTLLRQLPELWAELPNYAVYGEELVHLTRHLVLDQPLWSGRVAFLTQITSMLTSQLAAVQDHPKRGMYTAFMVS